MYKLNKIKVYGACINGGDGSVIIRWYLTEEKAEKAEETQEEGWGENCVFKVETYEGSNVHKLALENES